MEIVVVSNQQMVSNKNSGRRQSRTGIIKKRKGKKRGTIMQRIK